MNKIGFNLKIYDCLCYMMWLVYSVYVAKDKHFKITKIRKNMKASKLT